MLIDQTLINEHAGKFALNARLVTALVQQESGGNPWAWNPEPKYRWLWDVRARRPFRPLAPAEISANTPPADFPVLAGDRDQEWQAQRASWGPLQVMGAVARERAFTGNYLTQLCDPRLGLYYGCAQLAHLRDEHLKLHGWEGVIAAYNAGSPRRVDGGGFPNQGYVDSVMKRLTGVQL